MRSRTVVMALALPFVVSTVAAVRPQAGSVADQIIAMVKAQWASEITAPTNVSASMKDVADDYTEFNAQYATRLEGKALNARLSEVSGSSVVRTVASEMANPKVQIYNDDVAILSYNYVGVTKDKDGTTESARAKSTRVYVKQGGR